MHSRLAPRQGGSSISREAATQRAIPRVVPAVHRVRGRGYALRWYEHALVPGLLQTEKYARAVLSTRPKSTEDEIDELLAARMTRREILSRDDPPLLYVLLNEEVLHRPVVSDDVMRAQSLHLAEMSRRPNITVQVVPYTAGGMAGAGLPARSV